MDFEQNEKKLFLFLTKAKTYCIVETIIKHKFIYKNAIIMALL